MGSSSGALKVVGGISAASVTAIATGVGIDQNNKHQKALEEEKTRQQGLAKQNALKEEARKAELAKQQVIQAAVKNIKESDVGKKNWFGGGLYEFLEDQDIIFSILKGGGSELTSSDFDFKKTSSGMLSTLNITVKVSISEDSNQLKTSETGKVKIEHLKALHGSNDWTWSCNIKFEALMHGDADQSIQTYGLKDKDKFFNDNNNGFFNVLKKDLTEESDEGNKTKWKNIKKRFVKYCSDADKQNKSQRKLELDWITFFLRPNRHGSSEKDKLYFTDKDPKAKEWFDQEITTISFQQ